MAKLRAAKRDRKEAATMLGTVVVAHYWFVTIIAAQDVHMITVRCFLALVHDV